MDDFIIMDNKKINDFGIKWIFIETTNFCNMHCIFCPSDHIHRPRKHMSFSQFKLIVDQLAELAPPNPVALNVLGEALLNPEIYKFIDYLSEKNLKLYLYTNCSIIDKHIKKICEKNNVEAIVFSLQTPTQKSYRVRGCSKNFSHYMSDIYDAIDYIIATKANEKMRVEIHIANTKHLPRFLGWDILNNDEETLKIIKEIGIKIKKSYYKRCSEEEINRLVECDFIKIPKKILDTRDWNFWGYEVVPNIFIRLKYFGNYGAPESILPKNVIVQENKTTISCNMAVENLSILVDGNITTCCLDIDGELSIGNINDVPLLTALQSAERKKMTQEVSGFRKCRRCLGTMEVDPNLPVSHSIGKILYLSSVINKLRRYLIG